MVAHGELESEAIDAAYRDKVSDLFGKLVTNLIVRSNTHDGEQKSIDEFAVGMNFARRAKDLAHDVTKAPLGAQPGSREKNT